MPGGSSMVERGRLHHSRTGIGRARLATHPARARDGARAVAAHDAMQAESLHLLMSAFQTRKLDPPP